MALADLVSPPYPGAGEAGKEGGYGEFGPSDIAGRGAIFPGGGRE